MVCVYNVKQLWKWKVLRTMKHLRAQKKLPTTQWFPRNGRISLSKKVLEILSTKTTNGSMKNRWTMEQPTGQSLTFFSVADPGFGQGGPNFETGRMYAWFYRGLQLVRCQAAQNVCSNFGARGARASGAPLGSATAFTVFYNSLNSKYIP